MIRRRYRTIHVAQLDRMMAEAEAIRRAHADGAPWARVARSTRIVDSSESPVWEIVLRIGARPRRS